MEQAVRDGFASLSEFESKSLLASYGIPVCREKLADPFSPAEISRAAREIGYPVVLKANGRKITHKTERGLVYLGIRDEEQLLAAAGDLRSKTDGLDCDGFLVQEMLAAKRELLCGLIRDPAFGPCVAFGLGGITAEVLDDVAFRIAPLTGEEALDMLDDFRGRKILDSFRGEVPVDREALAGLLAGLGRLGDVLGVESVDANPVLIVEGRPVVVDALVTLKPGAGEKAEEENPPVPEELWESLFRPRRLAIVGVSRSLTHPGRLMLESLRGIGYSGEICLVNPEIEEIDGLPVYPSLKDAGAGGPLDLVLVAVGASLVPQVLREAGAAGARWAVVLTSGYSELGTPEGQAKETEILAVARQQNIRLIGPNCIGIYSPGGGVAFFPQQEPGSGIIGGFAQSGSITAFFELLLKERGMYASKLVSIGNALDVGPEELAAYLGEDQETKIIISYLEGVRRPRAFFEALRKVDKPVIVYKAGVSRSGSRAAASHTGALAGSARIWEGMFKQTGVVSVGDLEELVDAAAAFYYLRNKNLAGRRMAVFTSQGGAGVSGADACESFGFELATLSDETQKKLREIMPGAGTSWQNPVDTGFGSIVPKVFRQSLLVVAQDPGVDLVLVVGGAPTFLGRRLFMVEEFAEWLTELAPAIKKPLAAVMNIPLMSRESYNLLYQAGIPVYSSVHRAVRALKHLYDFSIRRQL